MLAEWQRRTYTDLELRLGLIWPRGLQAEETTNHGDHQKYTRDLGTGGRAMGFIVGLLLAVPGLVALATCGVCLYLRVSHPDDSLLVGAGISGLFALVLCGYGGDMLYRAISGAVPADQFFAGKLGAFRASLGFFFSMFLFASLAGTAIATLMGRDPFPPGMRLWPFATLTVLSAAATWTCGRVLYRKWNAPPAPAAEFVPPPF